MSTYLWYLINLLIRFFLVSKGPLLLTPGQSGEHPNKESRLPKSRSKCYLDYDEPDGVSGSSSIGDVTSSSMCGQNTSSELSGKTSTGGQHFTEFLLFTVVAFGC